MAARILSIQEPAKQLQEKDKVMNLHLEADEQIWLQIVPGALCKWDPTMEMIRGPDNEIYLRTTRDIMPREELRAWFSPSLEREIGISKNDMAVKSKGIGQQCPTCDMINQRSLFATHALLRCQSDEAKRENHQSKYKELSGSSSLSLTQTSSSSLDRSFRMNPSSYELDSNLHHNLHSAFRRLAKNVFPPFQDPKLASLISSFSEPRHLKETSSETLADHHKNEFRKKFQGNEHYLRKHLYREGSGEKTFMLTKERFLASLSMQKPVKYETLEMNCRDDNEMMRHEQQRWDEMHSRDMVMVSDARRSSDIDRNTHMIWSPYSGMSEDWFRTSSNDQRDSELSNRVSTIESFHDKDEESRDIGPCTTCHDSTCTCNGECDARSRNKFEEQSEKLNDIADQNQIERNELKDQVNETSSLEVQDTISSDSIHGGMDSKVEQKCSPIMESVEQHSFMPRYCVTAPRPWYLPENSFLSSVTRKELAQYHERASTFSMASLSRYQHLNPFALPYTLGSSPQSTSRASQGFTCDFCGKVYCRKYVLKIHMRTHTGFKPLKCKFCDKSFSDPSNMKKHVKLHDSENTVHKCKHCGRSFVRYRGLLNHIKSKHTEPLNIEMLI
ncbi:gastrula zinc finger protein xFG20-1-like isoform X2 [Actinia tenebrosa]|nr:gastrula zinc finger protein xFG20-1-like isoform X2 [Actinia tenebrosa]